MGRLVGLVACCILTAVLSVAVLVTVVRAAPRPPGHHPRRRRVVVGAGHRLCPTAGRLSSRRPRHLPGLPWSVLAAIGTVESDRGGPPPPVSPPGRTPPGPRARSSSSRRPSPPTPWWARAASAPRPLRSRSTPPTPPPPCCAPTVAGAPAGLADAVSAYNHDAAYVDTVLTLALAFTDDPAARRRGGRAIAFAGGQLGTPYRWGGTGSGGFDCSGLAQAAYARAGVALPRVAQDQFEAGPPVRRRSPPRATCSSSARALPGWTTSVSTSATA